MLQLGQVPAMVCSGQKVQNRKVLSGVGVIILGPRGGLCWLGCLAGLVRLARLAGLPGWVGWVRCVGWLGWLDWLRWPGWLRWLV